MIQRIKQTVIAIMLTVGAVSALSLFAPTTVNADHNDGHTCSSGLLTFPAWYDGLLEPATCDLKSPADFQEKDSDGSIKSTESESSGLSTFIFIIALNVVEILLQIVGYAAVGYIIYGGFKYLTSAGMADRITAGRKIIMNALVGLVISFMSIAVVNLVSRGITSTAGDGCTTSNQGRVDADCVGVARVDDAEAIAGILNTVYFAAGVIAVIVIIISGILYAISQGEAAKIKRAKDGILYAVVGLVIILLAFIITNFVIGRF